MFANIFCTVIVIIIGTWITYWFYDIINEPFSRQFKVAMTITYIGVIIMLIMGLINGWTCYC